MSDRVMERFRLMERLAPGRGRERIVKTTSQTDGFLVGLIAGLAYGLGYVSDDDLRKLYETFGLDHSFLRRKAND